MRTLNCLSVSKSKKLFDVTVVHLRNFTSQLFRSPGTSWCVSYQVGRGSPLRSYRAKGGRGGEAEAECLILLSPLFCVALRGGGGGGGGGLPPPPPPPWIERPRENDFSFWEGEKA